MKRKLIIAIVVTTCLIMSCMFILTACSPSDKTGMKAYTITFDSKGGTDCPAIETKGNTTLTLPTAPTKDNLTFAGWYFDDGNYLDSFTSTSFLLVPLSKNVTVYAKWVEVEAANLYTITFDSKGGTDCLAIETKGNTTLTLPAAPIKGILMFAGWYFDDGNYLDSFTATSFLLIPLSNNITVYAKWLETDNEQLSYYTINVYVKLIDQNVYKKLDTQDYAVICNINDSVTFSAEQASAFYPEGKLVEAGSRLNIVVDKDSSKNVFAFFFTRELPKANVTQVPEKQALKVAVVDSAVEKIKVDVYDEDVLVSTDTIKSSELDTTEFKAYYGYKKVVITYYYFDNFFAPIQQEHTIGLYASEYNFAPLNGSFPVALMSLSYWKINTIPTFVFLERTAAYNWDSMPDNVFAFPKAADITVSDFHVNNRKMAAWIGELNKINPESKFNLYCVDNYAEFIITMIHANNVKNYDVTLLSDGVGSYGLYGQKLGTAEGDTIYEEMKIAYNGMVAKAKAGADVDTIFANAPHISNANFSRLNWYTAMIAYEDANVKWWLANPSLINEHTNVAATAMKSKYAQQTGAGGSIISVAIKTMLEALSEAEQTELKTLYNFSSETFAEAEQAGKPVMMFLGTRTSNELYFDDYVKFMTSFYGDTYVYYYKGHPGTPTDLDAEKAAKLKELGLIDVNSSIAAELILFYYPEVFMSGYTSTVYTSARPDKVKVIFATKIAAESMQYVADYYITFKEGTQYKVECHANANVGVWDSSDPTNFSSMPSLT